MGAAGTGVAREATRVAAAETGMSAARVAAAMLRCDRHCSQQQDERRNA